MLGKMRLKTPTDIAYYKILLVAGWDGGKILSLSLVAPQALVSSVLQLGNRHLAELRATWQQATWQGLVLTLASGGIEDGRTTFHSTPTTDSMEFLM